MADRSYADVEDVPVSVLAWEAVHEEVPVLRPDRRGSAPAGSLLRKFRCAATATYLKSHRAPIRKINVQR